MYGLRVLCNGALGWRKALVLEGPAALPPLVMAEDAVHRVNTWQYYHWAKWLAASAVHE